MQNSFTAVCFSTSINLQNEYQSTPEFLYYIPAYLLKSWQENDT